MGKPLQCKEQCAGILAAGDTNGDLVPLRNHIIILNCPADRPHDITAQEKASKQKTETVGLRLIR